MEVQNKTRALVTVCFLQITAHVLKQAVLPAAQKAEDSLERPHSPGIVEPLRAAAEERPQDAQKKGSAQLSCSVKEEPDADGQEMGESGGCTWLWVSWWECGHPQLGWGPRRDCRVHSRSLRGRKKVLAHCVPCSWHTRWSAC